MKRTVHCPPCPPGGMFRCLRTQGLFQAPSCMDSDPELGEEQKGLWRSQTASKNTPTSCPFLSASL